jgi:hypothetical protein
MAARVCRLVPIWSLSELSRLVEVLLFHAGLCG